MSAELTLANGPMRCTVRPALGACITGLWFHHTNVLRTPETDPPASARQSGCYALVPFSNRVAHATLKWAGTSHPLVQNNAPEPHAIHGLGWQRPWELLEQDAHFAMLAFEHRADAEWPFAFDASQTFRLGPHTLELTLGITNQSGTRAPVGLGWHPNFAKRAGSRVRLQASGRWEMGADRLPTHREATTGLDADCAALDIDHCFDGWNGTALLEDARLAVRIDSNLARLVAFTNGARDYISLEPVSHVNNAINLAAAGADAQALGLVVLEPGESFNAQMSITVERAA